jgi:hypothetical protein
MGIHVNPEKIKRSGPEASDQCSELTGEIADKEVGIEIGGS